MTFTNPHIIILSLAVLVASIALLVFAIRSKGRSGDVLDEEQGYDQEYADFVRRVWNQGKPREKQ